MLEVKVYIQKPKRKRSPNSQSPGHYNLPMPTESIGKCMKCKKTGDLADGLCIKCWDRTYDSRLDGHESRRRKLLLKNK